MLGTAPLVVLRNSEGRLPFVLATALATAVLFALGYQALAVPYLALVLLVYVFIEGVDMGGSLLKSGIMALTFCSGLSLIGLSLWARTVGIPVPDLVSQNLEALISKVPQLSPQLLPQLDEVVVQLPSAILILMSVALWLGVLFGKKFSVLQGDSPFAKLSLKDFNLPDAFIWAFIASLPGTFLVTEHTLTYFLSVNTFNLMLFVYFLKGMAIVATYFSVIKVGLVWQALLYSLLISQLFLLVGLIGLSDMWLNIRSKLLKKSVEPIER